MCCICPNLGAPTSWSSCCSSVWWSKRWSPPKTPWCWCGVQLGAIEVWLLHVPWHRKVLIHGWGYGWKWGIHKFNLSSKGVACCSGSLLWGGVSTWFKIKGSVEVELYCPSVATLTKLGSIGQLAFSTPASCFRLQVWSWKSFFLTCATCRKESNLWHRPLTWYCWTCHCCKLYGHESEVCLQEHFSYLAAKIKVVKALPRWICPVVANVTD